MSSRHCVHRSQARSQDLCMEVSIFTHAREKFHDHTHLLGHVHHIKNTKATKKCVSSSRNGDVLVVKSVMF